MNLYHPKSRRHPNTRQDAQPNAGNYLAAVNRLCRRHRKSTSARIRRNRVPLFIPLVHRFNSHPAKSVGLFEIATTCHFDTIGGCVHLFALLSRRAEQNLAHLCHCHLWLLDGVNHCGVHLVKESLDVFCMFGQGEGRGAFARKQAALHSAYGLKNHFSVGIMPAGVIATKGRAQLRHNIIKRPSSFIGFPLLLVTESAHCVSSLSSACAALVVLTLADSSKPHQQSRPELLAVWVSCGQAFVSQPLPADSSNHTVKPLSRVVFYVALVQPPCKFIGIAANVLGADVVKGSVDSPLENGPNAFNAVSGSNSPRVFASGMIDGFMLEKQAAKVREHNAVIGIELRPQFDVVVNLRCDGLHSAFIHRGKDGATVTFPHPKHGSFADSTTSSFQLFVLMLVPFLAADETLVKFHDAFQFCELRPSASLTYPMENEPCALLRDTDFLRQLQRTDALTSSNEQVHGIEPLVKRDMGTLKYGSRSDGEVNLTGVAAVVATLTGSHSIAGFASWTDSTIGPKPRFQIEPSRLRIGKHLEQLKRAYCAFAHALCPVRREYSASSSLLHVDMLRFSRLRINWDSPFRNCSSIASISSVDIGGSE
jgi:hypothetical protein